MSISCKISFEIGIFVGFLNYWISLQRASSSTAHTVVCVHSSSQKIAVTEYLIVGKSANSWTGHISISMIQLCVLCIPTNLINRAN